MDPEMFLFFPNKWSLSEVRLCEEYLCVWRSTYSRHTYRMYAGDFHLPHLWISSGSTPLGNKVVAHPDLTERVLTPERSIPHSTAKFPRNRAMCVGTSELKISEGGTGFYFPTSTH